MLKFLKNATVFQVAALQPSLSYQQPRPTFAPFSALNRMDLVQGKFTLKRKKLIWLLVGTIKSMASGYPATLA